MDRRLLFDDWLSAQAAQSRNNRKFPKKFIGERSYPHFDSKVFEPKTGNDPAKIEHLRELMTDFTRLEKHGFLPFIKFETRERRFRQPPYDYEYSSLRRGRDQTKFPHLKSRPIMYASHFDACILSFMSFQLSKLYEAKLTERGLAGNVLAYRSIDGKNNVDFAKEAFQAMTQREEYDCMMLDIKSFFDNIDHSQLYTRWESLLSGGFKVNRDHEITAQMITKYRYISKRQALGVLISNKRRYLFSRSGSFKLASLDDYNEFLKKIVRRNKADFGIPQGSPISGMLANIYMLEFDLTMKYLVVDRLKGVYQRYSDDIFILVPKGKAVDVYAEVQHALAASKLKLGPNKTEAFRKVTGEERLTNITSFVEPDAKNVRQAAQYLGLHFDGRHISIRPSTLAKHIRGKRRNSYMQSAHIKTGSKLIARQTNKIRQQVHKTRK